MKDDEILNRLDNLSSMIGSLCIEIKETQQSVNNISEQTQLLNQRIADVDLAISPVGGVA